MGYDGVLWGWPLYHFLCLNLKLRFLEKLFCKTLSDVVKYGLPKQKSQFYSLYLERKQIEIYCLKYVQKKSQDGFMRWNKDRIRQAFILIHLKKILQKERFFFNSLLRHLSTFFFYRFVHSIL